MNAWWKRWALVLACAGSIACSSDVDALLNADEIADKVDTVEDCFPAMWEKVAALFEIVDVWTGSTTPPANLACNVNDDANGSIAITLPLANCSITMSVQFRDPSGNLITKPHSLPTGACTPQQFQDGLAEAASNMAAGDRITGNWGFVSGAQSVGGSGEVTGTLNAALDIGTVSTTAVGSGGNTPAANTIQNFTTGCTLDAQTTNLDTNLAGDYGIGTIDFTLNDGNETAVATLTMNGTVNATITVQDVPGSFAFNLETGAISYSG